MTQVFHPPIATRSTTPDNDFGGIIRQPSRVPSGQRAPDFPAIQSSPEFVALRRRFRCFVFPLSALFLVWYLTYVLLAAFARGFMSHKLVGSINVGLVLGLLQFVSTVIVTFAYVRYARNRLDPRAAAIRETARG